MASSEQSGIIRTRRDRNNPYTMVNKAAFEDERLSWEARGVLAYLLTKPDDWQVRTSELLKRAPKCGGDKMARILKELEQFGYLVRERKNIGKGRFEWTTTVYENPLDAQEVTEKIGNRRRRTNDQPLPENPVMDTPHQEAKSTITGFTINGSAVNGKPADIVTTDSTNSLSKEREARKPRATPPPKQTNLDSFHAAVLAYKELSGVRKIAPATATLIASTVTDVDLWRQVVIAWCSRYSSNTNVGGMLDWYAHPERMERKNGRTSPPAPASYAVSEPPKPLPSRDEAEQVRRAMGETRPVRGQR